MSDYPYEAIVFLGDKDEIVKYTGDEVVRCKDCKYFGEIGCAIEIVDDTDKPTENDYCSFGEKKDE